MENIEKKLFNYALYDKDTETYSVLVVGYDDKESLEYYFKSFNDIYKSLDNYYKGDKLDNEKKNLIDKIKNSCIYKIGYFDTFKGEFVNDKSLLVDLFDFKFNNDESEDNKN